ncbi:hypothetical protein WA158_007820 [Blastocystis sp. Blastoise]
MSNINNQDFVSDYVDKSKLIRDALTKEEIRAFQQKLKEFKSTNMFKETDQKVYDQSIKHHFSETLQLGGVLSLWYTCLRFRQPVECALVSGFVLFPLSFYLRKNMKTDSMLNLCDRQNTVCGDYLRNVILSNHKNTPIATYLTHRYILKDNIKPTTKMYSNKQERNSDREGGVNDTKQYTFRGSIYDMIGIMNTLTIKTVGEGNEVKDIEGEMVEFRGEFLTRIIVNIRSPSPWKKRQELKENQKKEEELKRSEMMNNTVPFIKNVSSSIHNNNNNNNNVVNNNNTIIQEKENEDIYKGIHPIVKERKDQEHSEYEDTDINTSTYYKDLDNQNELLKVRNRKMNVMNPSKPNWRNIRKNQGDEIIENTIDDAHYHFDKSKPTSTSDSDYDHQLLQKEAYSNTMKTYIEPSSPSSTSSPPSSPTSTTTPSPVMNRYTENRLKMEGKRIPVDIDEERENNPDYELLKIRKVDFWGNPIKKI